MDQQCFYSEVVAPTRSPPHADPGIARGDEKPMVGGGEKTLKGRSLHLTRVSRTTPGLIDRDNHPFGSSQSIYSLFGLFLIDGPLPPKLKEDSYVEG